MTWFRVDTDIVRADVVHVLAETLSLKRPAEALGYYIGVLAGFGEYQPDGVVGAVTDTSLEDWAGWRGKKGEFARAFRRRCVSDGTNQKDPAGTIRGWYRNRKLIEKQVRDRLRPDGRKRDEEDDDPPDPPENPRGIPPKSPLDSYGQRGRRTETNSSDRPVEGGRLDDRVRAEVGGEAVLEFLDNLPDGEHRISWVGVLQGCLDGLGLKQGRGATMSELGAACIEYLKDNPAKWGVPHFRAYVNRVMNSARQPPRETRRKAGGYEAAIEAARRGEEHGAR